MFRSRPRGEIDEVSLPGIGQRYDLRTVDGSHVTVVIHHNGRRDLYVVEGDTPTASVELSDSQARSLGAILGGAYFKPAIVEEVEAAVDGLLIDWATLDDDAPGAGRTIAELGVRSRTRMTIVAILRDRHTIVAPDPGERLAGGDRLVVIGRHEDLAGFRRHVVRA